MGTLYIATISILVFVLCSLLLKKKKHNSDHILIVWLFLALLSEIGFYWLAAGNYGEHVNFYRLFFGTQLLHAPLLFFYILTLFQKNFTFNWKNLIHLTPLLLFYLLHINEFSKSVEVCACAKHFGCFTCTMSCSTVHNLSKMIINTFYLALAFFAYKEHRLNIKAFENISKSLWAGMLLFGGFALNGLIIFYRISEIANIEYLFRSMSFTDIHVFISVLIILFGFLMFNLDSLVKWVLTMKKFILKVNSEKLVSLINEANQTSIAGSIQSVTNENNKACVAEEKIGKYYDMILSYMEQEKPYLDSQLSKAKFAEKLGIPEHHLSVVLKERFNKSFNTFINAYRLSLVLERMSSSDYKDYTLLYLAIECGFNSKSTFNRFFKTQMGMTPSQFLKMNTENYNIRIA